MENKVSKILNGKFSILYDGVEVLKNLEPVSVEIQHIPPYDHYVYSFKAISESKEIHIFNQLAQEGTIGYSKLCQVSNGFEECDAYIDSYEMNEYPMDIRGNYGPNTYMHHQEFIIYGHVDSRMLEDNSWNPPIEKDKKELDSIDSRFDILDL